MYCQYCGREIDDNSNFCSYCGHRINKQQKTYQTGPIDQGPIYTTSHTTQHRTAPNVPTQVYETTDPEYDKSIRNSKIISWILIILFFIFFINIQSCQP